MAFIRALWQELRLTYYFLQQKKRQEEMLQSAKKRYLVLGGGLDRAGPRHLESPVVPGIKKSKNPRTQKLENPSLPTTYIGKAPLIPTLDQTSQEGKKSTTIKEKLRSYCPNIYTVTYIIFKLNSNTFFIEFQTSILVITRTRSKCFHRVRGEFGMVIIVTSIFERVLVYFLKIEFFLTSNLE